MRRHRELGGAGRPVVGRVMPVMTSKWRHLELSVAPPEPFASIEWDKLTEAQRKSAEADAEKSQAYQDWMRNAGMGIG